MKRTILTTLYIGLVVLTAACGRRDASDDANQDEKKNILDIAANPAPPGSTSTVTVDGCLSASGEQFMLTSLEKDSATTVVYQLMNADDQLKTMIGKEVRVSGEAQATQSTEAREIGAPAPAATSGKTDATVSTTTNTKLDVNKLTVASVTATGDTCPR